MTINAPSADPCAGLSIGQTCTGGAIYAGTGYGDGLTATDKYMVTPSDITGGTRAWATGTYATSSTGATDLSNGKANTATIVALASTTPAALACSDLDYGGYTDWFLPAKNELSTVLFANRTALGGFAVGSTATYWSSSEGGTTSAWRHSFGSNAQININKTVNARVRCVRTY
ncbi:MAG: DUF1566 domain-containing protein [Candidatus Omnitrophota bacterium]|nr:DUF1566 domain-containing protein [Candidatus Omnitrophota bacterium]